MPAASLRYEAICVVGRGQREGLGRQLLARLRAHAVQRLDVAQDRCVLGRAAHRRHAREVLGRRAEERHAADVDLLQRLVEGRLGVADGLCERVEVHDHHVDRLDLRVRQLLEVVGTVPPGEQRGEDRGMQRLHPPIEDLVGSGEVADRPDALEARIGQVRPRAVGGEAFHAGIDQTAGELDDAFSVTDGEQGAQSTSSGAVIGCLGGTDYRAATAAPATVITRDPARC